MLQPARQQRMKNRLPAMGHHVNFNHRLLAHNIHRLRQVHKRPFAHAPVGDAPLQHNFRIGRHFQVACQALHQRRGRERIGHRQFIHARRRRHRSRQVRCQRNANADGHRQIAGCFAHRRVRAAPLHNPRRKMLLIQPQQPMVTHIASQLRVFGYDHRTGDVMPGVLRQVQQNWQFIQINRFHDNFLARGRFDHRRRHRVF